MGRHGSCHAPSHQTQSQRGRQNSEDATWPRLAEAQSPRPPSARSSERCTNQWSHSEHGVERSPGPGVLEIHYLSFQTHSGWPLSCQAQPHQAALAVWPGQTQPLDVDLCSGLRAGPGTSSGPVKPPVPGVPPGDLAPQHCVWDFLYVSPAKVTCHKPAGTCLGLGFPNQKGALSPVASWTCAQCTDRTNNCTNGGGRVSPSNLLLSTQRCTRDTRRITGQTPVPQSHLCAGYALCLLENGPPSSRVQP